MLTPNAIRSATALPGPRSAPASAANETAPLAQHMHMMGATMAFVRNTEIFGENEPADYLYKLISGTVRTYKILSDGRRQIGGFYLPGDVFGLEFGDAHTHSAEAMTDAKVLVIKRSALTELAGRDATVAHDRLVLLIKSAQERVASFLLEMAERAPCGDSIELPMPRQDIADYLGLTIETVSRTFTALEGSAAIDVPTSRRIVLRNRAALHRMN